VGGDGSSGTDDQRTSGTWPKKSCAFWAAAPEEDDDKERQFGDPSFPLSACKWIIIVRLLDKLS
jgi:hypothetical protein